MFVLLRETSAPIRRPLSSWTAFWLVTGLLAVACWFVALGGVAALGATGLGVCQSGIPPMICTHVWLWVMFGGWVGAIVAVVTGALVGARTDRSLWSGYPIGGTLYGIGVIGAYAVAFL